MDGRTARKAGRRSRAPRTWESPDRRRREIVAILGDGLARVIERCPACPGVPGENLGKLSESTATRVELPSDAGLSVAAGSGGPRDGGS